METKSQKEEKKSKSNSSTTKVLKVKRYASWAYCNLKGLSPMIREVVSRKFKDEGKKTEKEWKEIFKKEGLV